MHSMTFKSKISRLIKNSLASSFCIFQLFSISTSSWAQGQMDLSTSEPVLIYQISHEILAEKETLKIEIYSDGYALLYYPSYMKNSGNYSVQLSQRNMQRMIHALDTPSVKNFSNKKVTLQKKAEDARQGIFSFVSDSSYSSFEMSRSDENGHNKIKQMIKCPHLQFDARHYPKITSLNRLAEVETMLSSLINQSDLQALSDD